MSARSWLIGGTCPDPASAPYCEDDPEPGTRTSRKKGLAQGAAIRRHHQAPLQEDDMRDNVSKIYGSGRMSRRQALGLAFGLAVGASSGARPVIAQPRPEPMQ